MAKTVILTSIDHRPFPAPFTTTKYRNYHRTFLIDYVDNISATNPDRLVRKLICKYCESLMKNFSVGCVKRVCLP